MMILIYLISLLLKINRLKRKIEKGAGSEGMFYCSVTRLLQVDVHLGRNVHCPYNLQPNGMKVQQNFNI